MNRLRGEPCFGVGRLHPLPLAAHLNTVMKTIRQLGLLITVACCVTGCKTAPQPGSTQTANSDNRSASGDEYNRTYERETRHHHRHGARDEAADDNWTSYDRDRAEDHPAGGGFAPRDSASGGNGAPRSSRHHNSRAVTAAPGRFDFYVLTLSWSPEYCQGHPGAAECSQHRAFTLHGLWPQNTDGTYPEDCSNAPGPANPAQYADIYPDATLLQHEWQTHGTCSGLGPDAFFALARKADQSIHIPAGLANLTQQTSLPPAQIVTMFTQSNGSVPASGVAISCGNNYLTAVEVCLDKNLKAESCSAVKTCGATQVRVPAP